MNLNRLILTTDQISEIRRIARDNAASPFEQMAKGKLMYDPMFVMEFERAVGLERCSSFNDEEKPLSRDDVVKRLIRLTRASALRRETALAEETDSAATPMNSRRSFLSSMLKASIACIALPAATTYERIWRPTPKVWYFKAAIDIAYMEGDMWEWEFRFIFNQRSFKKLEWPKPLGDGCAVLNYEGTPNSKWRRTHGYA